MDLRPHGRDQESEGEPLAAESRRLEELAQNIGSGLDVKALVRAGDPAGTIVQVAHDQGVDLILMPTHGYGPFRRFLLGSVTAKVLHDAECPVLTGVHMPETPSASHSPYRRIVCAVDLGEHSERVLRWAADLATACDADLTVLHAVPYSQFTGADVPDFEYMGRKVVRRPAPDFIRECWGKAIRVAEGRLDALIGKVGCTAERQVEDASPTEAARRAVEKTNADLLVIGRSPARGMGRLRTHAYALIRESPCLVVSI